MIIMATKTANVLARVEPEVKEKAESIMAQLGVPASTVINMLYKQIILTKSIPFSLTIPTSSATRDEMSDIEFDAIMSKGLTQAKNGDSSSANDFILEIRKEYDL